MALTELLPKSNRAPALYADFWFNSEPVLVSALQGSVLFLYFWDSSCAQSVRFLPYVKEWDRKYREAGLVTVGVHTPRYPFGKDPELVQNALHRLDVRFPVAMDNEGVIAANYGMRSWPMGVIIDKHGFIRAVVQGDGSFAASERIVQGHVYDVGLIDQMPELMEPLREIDREGSLTYHATPELQTGYLRGSLGNIEGYLPESEVEYADPRIYIDGKFYANGVWQNGRDCLRLAMPNEREGQIILLYQGSDVSGVLGAEKGWSVHVSVRQDDAFLTPATSGEDVRVQEDGTSVLVVGEPRLYRIARNKDFGEHLLRLTAAGGKLSLYSISFGTAIVPDLITTN
jgi:thiol-disulfide isomerase/thioredoxin